MRGFSLIELMVTLVIVSILLTIAIPSYQQYVARAALTEAFDALAVYRLRMEQSYQDTGNYGVGGCAIATANTDTFNLACTLTNDAQGFTVTATGNGTNGVTNGYVFSLNNAGVRLTTAFPGAGVPANCWLTRAGEC